MGVLLRERGSRFSARVVRDPTSIDAAGGRCAMMGGCARPTPGARARKYSGDTAF